MQDGLKQVHWLEPRPQRSAWCPSAARHSGHNTRLRHAILQLHFQVTSMGSPGSSWTSPIGTTLQSILRHKPLPIELQAFVEDSYKENNKTGDHHGRGRIRTPECEKNRLAIGKMKYHPHVRVLTRRHWTLLGWWRCNIWMVMFVIGP